MKERETFSHLIQRDRQGEVAEASHWKSISFFFSFRFMNLASGAVCS